MYANIFFGVHWACLLIIFFASVQTSCLNEVNRIDLHAFFSIPRSHEPSKECTLFHVVLMNGLYLRVALSHAQCVPPGCLVVSRLSSPGTRRHVGTNLSSVFLPDHARQQPRPWVSNGPLSYNHLVILYRHLQAKFGLRRYQTRSYVKPRGFTSRER